MNQKNRKTIIFLTLLILSVSASAITPYKPIKYEWEYFMPAGDFYFLDLDQDGEQEFYVILYDREFVSKNYITVFNKTGELQWSTWLSGGGTHGCGEREVVERMNMMYVDDFNKDTNLDIVTSTKVRGTGTNLNPIEYYEYRYDWITKTRRMKDLWADRSFDGIATNIIGFDYENDGVKDIIATSSKGIVYVYGISGSVKAKIDLQENANDLITSDIDADGREEIILATFKHVYVLDNGKVKWSYPLEEGAMHVATAAYDGKQTKEVIASDGTNIYRIDQGTLIWKKEVGQIEDIVASDIDNDTQTEVLVATGSTIRAYDSQGEFDWEYDLPNKVISMLLMSEYELGVATSNRIYMFETDNRYAKNQTAYKYFLEARGYYLQTPRNCLALNESIGKALEIFREIKNTEGIVECEVIIDQCTIDHVNKELADKYYEMALEYFKNKNFEEARVYNQKALEIYIDIDYSYGITQLCSKLFFDIEAEEQNMKVNEGDRLYDQAYRDYIDNKLKDAAEKVKKAAEIYKELDHLEGIIKTEELEEEIRTSEKKNQAAELLKRGTGSFNEGSYPEAISFYEQSLEIYRELNMTNETASTENLLTAAEKYSSAEDYYFTAKENYEKGDFENVTSYAEKARDLYRELADYENMAICEELINTLERKKNEALYARIAIIGIALLVILVLSLAAVQFIKKRKQGR